VHEGLGQLLNHLPPKTAGALVQAINRCGAQLGIGPDWVRRWIGFTIVADALAQYQPNVFELKGGAAIELRLRRFDGAAVRPRATRDLDATLRGELDAIEGAVRAALAEPRHGFAFRVETDDSPVEKMRRLNVHVSYRVERFGRVVETAFSNVRLEVSAYEGMPRDPELVSAYSLKPFGIEGPEHLPCLPLTKQIAQKIHAVTDVPESGANERFRDLLDIVLLSAIEAPSAELREVCEETFNIRARQPWPPEIIAHPHWVEPLEARAKEIGLEQRSADEIVAHVIDYVHRIAEA
jgi:hypothetical protein